jgi:hypothetical protein
MLFLTRWFGVTGSERNFAGAVCHQGDRREESPDAGVCCRPIPVELNRTGSQSVTDKRVCRH